MVSGGRCAAALAGLTLLLSCGTPQFSCEDDLQCDGGQCQPNGYCSFPDPDCPSGQRYGGLAPGGLAGQCVEPSAQTSGPATTVGSDVSTSASSVTAGTDGGQSTGATTTAGVSDSATTIGTSTTATTQDASSSSSSGGAESTTTQAGSSSGGTGTAETCPAFADDFEDAAIDPSWVVSHPEFVVEEGGALQIIVDPPVGPFVRATLGESYDLTQGWFRGELGLTPDSFYVQQDLELFNGDDLDESVVVIVEGTMLIARYRPPGDGFENLVVTDYLPDEHQWLQLRGDGSTVFFETSADGVVFEAFASHEVPFALSNVRPGVSGYNYGEIAENDILSFEQVAVCTQP